MNTNQHDEPSTDTCPACPTCPTCRNGYNELCLNFNMQTVDTSMGLGYKWLCEQGCNCNLQHIMQHIYEDTLLKYHESQFHVYFPLVVASTIENINLWVSLYGVPKFKFSLPIHIPKENLIYILDQGYDPNNFLTGHFMYPIERFCGNKKNMVEEMSIVEIVKLLVNYGYKMTPYVDKKTKNNYYDNNIFYCVYDFQIFKELLDLTTFTIEDAKSLIADILCFAIDNFDREQLYVQKICYLVKKYELREYVESLPEIQRVIRFIKILKNCDT